MRRSLGVLTLLALLVVARSSGAISTTTPPLAKKAHTRGKHHGPPPHDLVATPESPPVRTTSGSIPEPATAALLGAGLLALGVTMARRRR